MNSGRIVFQTRIERSLERSFYQTITILVLALGSIAHNLYGVPSVTFFIFKCIFLSPGPKLLDMLFIIDRERTGLASVQI